MPYGRELVVVIVAAVMAIALLVALVRAVIEQLNEERRRKLERQPPLPLPPAVLRDRATPPALQVDSGGHSVFLVRVVDEDTNLPTILTVPALKMAVSAGAGRGTGGSAGPLAPPALHACSGGCGAATAERRTFA